MKRNTIIAVAATAIIALIAYNQFSPAGRARAAIKETLFDPGSAEFGDFYRDGDIGCLEVNAKNRMGGYVGQKSFLLQRGGFSWRLADESSLDCEAAIKFRKDIMKSADEHKDRSPDDYFMIDEEGNLPKRDEPPS